MSNIKKFKTSKNYKLNMFKSNIISYWRKETIIIKRAKICQGLNCKNWKLLGDKNYIFQSSGVKIKWKIKFRDQSEINLRTELKGI